MGCGSSSPMLVSHRHRFIYTKTAKTGGTSVESFFERFCLPEGQWKQSHERAEHVSEHGIIGYRGPGGERSGAVWWNHMPAAAIRAGIGGEVWNGYFKFCVVRNPFEKCISAFYHLGRGYRVDPALREELRHEHLTAEQLRFIGFLRHRAPVDRDKYLIDGEFCLDDVIRHESMETDLRKVCDRIGVPYDGRYLPGFKRGIRPRWATVGSLYTGRSRALVEEAFAFELEFFGYRFPDAR